MRVSHGKRPFRDHRDSFFSPGNGSGYDKLEAVPVFAVDGAPVHVLTKSVLAFDPFKSKRHLVSLLANLVPASVLNGEHITDN